MRILAVLMPLLLLVATACGKSAAPVVGNESTTPEAAPVVGAAQPVRVRPTCARIVTTACAADHMAYFRDLMCDCADAGDKVCAQVVVDDITSWTQQAVSTDQPGKPTEAEMVKMDGISQALADCTTTAFMGSAEDRDGPDGEPAPPAPYVRKHPVGPKPKQPKACKEKPGELKCAVKMMTYYADLTCSCAEPACVEQVNQEMTKWTEALARTEPSAQKVSAADTERLTTESTRLADCMTDAMLGDPGAR